MPSKPPFFSTDDPNNAIKNKIKGDSLAKQFLRNRNGLEDVEDLYKEFNDLPSDAKRFFFYTVSGFLYEINNIIPFGDLND